MKMRLERITSLGLALGLVVVMGTGCAADCKRRKVAESEPARVPAAILEPAPIETANVEPAPVPVPKEEPVPMMQAQEDEVSKIVQVTKAQGGFLAHINNSILFKPGMSVLGPNGKKEIGKLGTILARFPKNKVHVAGHTDNTGKPEMNRALSLKRARAVKDVLVKIGVKESRVTVEGFGDTKPVEDNSTSEGQAVNRRVELLITESPADSEEK